MSIIKDQVEAYIAYKNGLGVPLVSEGSAMRQFARYADSVGHEGPITVEIAVAWARSGDNHAEGYEIKRYEMARRVHEYACALAGIPSELPPGLIGKSCNRITPYIFTDEEISLLMHAASRMYVQQDPMKPLAYSTAIGLLRATGMRPNEALSLEDSDFDPDAGTILVRKGKNSRERILPVDPTTVDAIVRYQSQRDALREGRECRRVFVANGDKPVRLGNLEHSFCEIRCVLLGRGEVWERRPPRIYDARHTFAVRTILSWHESGEDVNAMLPVLATYMGHKKISETYWYLTGTPELLQVAGDAFERIAKGGGGL